MWSGSRLWKQVAQKGFVSLCQALKELGERYQQDAKLITERDEFCAISSTM